MTRRRRAKVAPALAAALVLAAVALAWARGMFVRRDATRPRGDPVGATTRLIEGDALEIWYPARAGASEERVRYEQTYLGFVAVGAAPADGPRRPLVVLSHGYTGGRLELAWLAERLAARGAVVIAIEHRDAGRAMDVELACERAAQLTKALDAVLADPTWGPRVDGERVVVAGHSFGGTTALLLAGAPLKSGARCADRRVKAVVATAPPVGIFDLEKLAASPPSLAAPPLLFAGTADSLHASAERVARAWPGAKVVTIQGGTHFVFKGPCTPWATLRMPMQCRDASSVDRRSVHDAVADAVLALPPLSR